LAGLGLLFGFVKSDLAEKADIVEKLYEGYKSEEYKQDLTPVNWWHTQR
jgi:hypothetical protein